jgi:hypothetical protein
MAHYGKLQKRTFWLSWFLNWRLFVILKCFCCCTKMFWWVLISMIFLNC